MSQKNPEFVSLKFEPVCTSSRRTWLRYFAAALCMGVAQGQEQVLLDYWWVWNDELPQTSDSTRVLRVIGEKGERYVEETSAATRTPLTLRARGERERILRQEAMTLARKHIAAGMSLAAAYEKA